MAITFEAVYENGVLRPLESLALQNMQHVLVTISGSSATADDVSGYFEPEEWEAAKHDDISLQEVRKALSTIPGSLADAVIASREER
jgi:predicted DNA-binding antitoxin AbrB/MazE fold protein